MRRQEASAQSIMGWSPEGGPRPSRLWESLTADEDAAYERALRELLRAGARDAPPQQPTRTPNPDIVDTMFVDTGTSVTPEYRAARPATRQPNPNLSYDGGAGRVGTGTDVTPEYRRGPQLQGGRRTGEQSRLVNGAPPPQQSYDTAADRARRTLAELDRLRTATPPAGEYAPAPGFGGIPGTDTPLVNPWGDGNRTDIPGTLLHPKRSAWMWRLARTAGNMVAPGAGQAIRPWGRNARVESFLEANPWAREASPEELRQIYRANREYRNSR